MPVCKASMPHLILGWGRCACLHTHFFSNQDSMSDTFVQLFSNTVMYVLCYIYGQYAAQVRGCLYSLIPATMRSHMQDTHTHAHGRSACIYGMGSTA